MKFSLNLLKQFVKIDMEPEKLGQLLTEKAFEVEEVTAVGGGDFGNITAAKVLEVAKHPNADRLRVIKLDVGGGKIVYPVVCGAFNFGPGDIVALALPGAKIAQNIHSKSRESFILRKATIRGVESQGMICAAFELGLENQPGEGIMLLKKSVAAGAALAEALDTGSRDRVLNISLPANRSDLYSHLGVGREVAAVTGAKLKVENKKLKLPKTSENFKIIVRSKQLCPRYYGVRMSVKIGPSPGFIQDVLSAVGMRPINNVVDVTNYVMMELGNPTHAFDAKFVKGDIVVKTAAESEKFLALNHKEYKLSSDDLVIADSEKTLGLAGIIGGKESEISETTAEIILEVANFQAQGIRKTSKRLDINTEGGRMWEKGIHPRLAELALARCLELLQKYAGADVLEFAKFESPVKPAAAIKFSASDINNLLGTGFSAKEIQKYLLRYGIISKIVNSKSGVLNSAPPWWRTDVGTVPDLAEEVLKLYGYNKVRPAALAITGSSIKPANPEDGVYETKNFFALLGYAEVQNYNFVSQKDIAAFGAGIKDHVEIRNPLSEDQRYLKKYPLISILKNIELNQKHFSGFKIFEAGKQYFDFGKEPRVLLAASFSKLEAAEKLLMKIKGDVLEYLKSLGINDVQFKTDENPARLSLITGGVYAGGIGYASEELKKNFGVEGQVVFAELELEQILPLKKAVVYEPISKLPSVERDISMVVDEKVKWSDIGVAVSPFMGSLKAKTDDKSGGYNLELSLFEAPFLAHDKETLKFHQELAKQGKKNLGIRLLFKPINRTMTDQEIAGILDQIVLKLQQEIKAEIR